ncbi:unnamed protein product, partial [marine sediment metagenome]
KYFKLLEKNKDAKLFWLVNDHDLEDNILLRQALLKQGRSYDMICNNPREGYRHWILGKNINGGKLNSFIDNWNTINLNVLIFNRQEKKKLKRLFDLKREGVVYFGTFRKHRATDMLDYNGLDYVISTSKKNQSKYRAAGIEATFIEKLKWDIGDENLCNFKYSIYFEDTHTHSNYAYMANRYYECLMCGVLMFFDGRCVDTISKSKYHVPNYLIVNKGKDLAEKISRLNEDQSLYKQLLAEQESNFDAIEKEKQEVGEQF